jgi:uncharacterized RDD family membrane protein YckC
MSSASYASSYASLTRRFVAFFLDLLILIIPCAIGAHLIPIAGGLVVLFFYAPILESSDIRATLGKHLMGIQVSDEMGRKISFRAALIRNVLKSISSILLFIGFFFALFTSRKQALHDMMADTFVVYGRSERSIADAWTKSVRELFHMGQSASSRTDESALSQLERLQALRDKGTLTDEEFSQQKAKILRA